MTKKDYEAAARIVQEMARPGDTGARYDAKVAEDAFVALFREDSPRFDPARFRAACVPGANVKARATRTDTYRHEAGEDVPRATR